MPKNPNKVQLLQGSFRFRPQIPDEELNRITHLHDSRYWKLTNKEILLRREYLTYQNERVAFDDAVEYANTLLKRKPSMKFSGSVFGLKLNVDNVEDDENGNIDYSKGEIKPFQYTLYISKGRENEVALKGNVCLIRISRMMSEEQKEALREKRKQMKERTLPANQKEYKQASVQTEDIPELAPLPKPAQRPSRQKSSTSSSTTSSITYSASSPPPPRQKSPTPPPKRLYREEREGVYTIDGKRNRIHDMSCLINNEKIDSDVMNDYLELLYKQGVAFQGKKPLKKKNVIVLPDWVYHTIALSYQMMPHDKEKYTKDLKDLATHELFKKKKINNCTLVMMPVNDNNHWILCDIEYKKKIISVFDSGSHDNQPIVENINNWLELIGLKRCQQVNIDVPEQRNDNDCGVFVMEFARVVLHDGQENFQQRDIPDIRTRILGELRSGKLVRNYAYSSS